MKGCAPPGAAGFLAFRSGQDIFLFKKRRGFTRCSRHGDEPRQEQHARTTFKRFPCLGAKPETTKRTACFIGVKNGAAGFSERKTRTVFKQETTVLFLAVPDNRADATSAATAASLKRKTPYNNFQNKCNFVRTTVSVTYSDFVDVIIDMEKHM